MNKRDLVILITLIVLAVVLWLCILLPLSLDRRVIVNPPFLTAEELDEYMFTLTYEDRPTRLFFTASDCLKGGSFNCLELSRFYCACLKGLDIPCDLCYYSPNGWRRHSWCRSGDIDIDWAAILTDTGGLDYGSYKVYNTVFY